ncbi:MAG: DsrE family protein [Gammaproteobacteria bacterium]|nr:DsrE family protein [Gammaproteobacteria bacterium]
MGKYLLVESSDPFESGNVPAYYELALNLARAGNDVTLFLVQNGVLPARKSCKHKGLKAAAAAGVQILADEFSLRERAIPANKLHAGVSAAALDIVIDQLSEGRKVLWH